MKPLLPSHVWQGDGKRTSWRYENNIDADVSEMQVFWTDDKGHKHNLNVVEHDVEKRKIILSEAVPKGKMFTAIYSCNDNDELGE